MDCDVKTDTTTFFAFLGHSSSYNGNNVLLFQIKFYSEVVVTIMSEMQLVYNNLTTTTTTFVCFLVIAIDNYTISGIVFS